MGLVPIDWPDLHAWSILTQTYLHPEEARIIRSLSQTYVTWAQRAKEYDCPAPFFHDKNAKKDDTIKQRVARYKK